MGEREDSAGRGRPVGPVASMAARVDSVEAARTIGSVVGATGAGETVVDGGRQ